MKIMIHSNAPWVPTGYGLQTRHLVRMLVELGHEVAVSAFYGLSGAVLDWPHPDLTAMMYRKDQDRLTYQIPIFPGGKTDYGLDTLVPHAEAFGADVVITLMDTWKLQPIADRLARWLQQTTTRLACWTPIDCAPIGRPDYHTLRQSTAVPLAMSASGRYLMQEAGLDPLLAPHAVDPEVFRPIEDRDSLRAALGLEGMTVIGINAANRDHMRKGYPEQFAAFAMFLGEHPNSRLMVHADPYDRGGLNLADLAEDYNITKEVIFADSYAQVTGALEGEDMATWYNCLDLLSACSYGEGFGIPILEAYACGIPVVTTDAGSMADLVTDEPYLVRGDAFRNPVHRAQWIRPWPPNILRAWTRALEATDSPYWPDRAAPYFIDTVAKMWPALLEQILAWEAPQPAWIGGES